MNHMVETNRSLQNRPDPGPAVIAAELRRFRRATWIVLALSLSAVAITLTLGNAPRPIVDRLNVVLALMVIATFVVLGVALGRFRKKCGAWPGQTGHPVK
jgi:FtsH-binding integral membrane protein